nr:uncharacterized protein LOC122271523 [Parasteatoda tepidariorum]
MPESTEAADQQIARVTVKPPPFWRANPELWFRQIESQFTLAGVSTESTKFHHVVAALQPEELAIISDIVISPPVDKPFAALKKRLCSQYAESEAQRLRDLISGMQLGDRRPSRLLLEMRNKAGARINDEILKSLFLQRLPTNVQQILAISNDNLDKLAEMADGIMATTTNAQSVSVVADSTDQTDLRSLLTEITARLARLEARTSDRSRSTSQKRSTSRSRQSANSQYCWYHKIFKQRATKCRPPCSFLPENC